MTIMVYEVLPWTSSEITCTIDHSLCRTVAFNPYVMTLPVVFHKVPYWDHSCSSYIQTSYQTRCLTHSAYYLPMVRQYITPIKMKLIVFGPKHSAIDGDVRISMKLGAHHITSVSSVKFLGVYIYIYIDDGLEWTEHNNHVVKEYPVVHMP